MPPSLTSLQCERGHAGVPTRCEVVIEASAGTAGRCWLPHAAMLRPVEEAERPRPAIVLPPVTVQEEEDEVEVQLDDRPMLVHKPGVYIGSCLAERNKPRLLAANITDILQVAEGLYPNWPMQFNYLNLQVQDTPSEDLVAHFPKCFAFMDAAIARGGGVLVHCVAGVSRSATIVIAYCMARYGMTLQDATDALKEVRPWVCPNIGFMEQLLEYERMGKDLSKWRAWRHEWRDTSDLGRPLALRVNSSSSTNASGSGNGIDDDTFVDASSDGVL